MFTRRPLPYGRPPFAEQPAFSSARALQPALTRYKWASPALLWALAGVAAGFGFAWVLFTAFGQDGDDFSSRFTTFGQNGEELPPLYDEKIVRTVFDTASPSIVEVQTVVQFGRRIGEGSGSGFFVDDQGHIITSDHVVEGAREITVRLNDGRELSAVKLGHSQHDDLALLRVDPAAVADIRPLPFADSDQVSIGEMAIAIGSPYENYNSLSLGIVSGLGEIGDEQPMGRLINPRERACHHRFDPDGRCPKSGQLRRSAAERRGRGDRGQLGSQGTKRCADRTRFRGCQQHRAGDSGRTHGTWESSHAHG